MATVQQLAVSMVIGGGDMGDQLMEIDGSFEVAVEPTAWGDVLLLLPRHDLRIELDPAEADRVCREIWTALGRKLPADDGRAA